MKIYLLSKESVMQRLKLKMLISKWFCHQLINQYLSLYVWRQAPNPNQREQGGMC